MCKYSLLSISAQLQTTFSFSILALCIIIVALTEIQLEWLITEMENESEQMLKNHIVNQMKYLATQEGLFLTQEFYNYVRLVKCLTELNEIAFGFSTISQSLFKVNLIPIKSDQIPTDYSSMLRSAYHSNTLELSELGDSILKNFTTLDYILPYLYDKAYTSLYEGIPQDDLLNFYPGSFFDGFYTPLVREWYYRAVNDPNQFVLTEPYQDAYTENWIFTVSKAVTNGNKLIGVAALDIMLSTMTQKTSRIKILDQGFALLVTAAGLIITMPESWQSDNPYRIYDQMHTGINHSFWEEIKVSPAGSHYDYIGINGIEYILLVQPILPIENNSTVFYYLLLFANVKEVYKPSVNLQSKFDTMYLIIFWTILSISLCILILSLVLVYFESRSVTIKIKGVENVLTDITRGALFSFNKVDLNLDLALLRSKGIEDLVLGLFGKTERIRKKEEDLNFHKWQTTRPSDCFIFSKWERTIYPFNRFNEEVILNNDIIDIIELISQV